MVCQRMRRCQGFVMMLLQLLFHCRLDLMRVFQAHGHHAQRVADEIQREVILA